jgi:hypothetical protein
VVGAELHRLHGGLDGRKCGDHDHLRFRREFLDSLENAEAVSIGEFEIEEDQIDLGRREPLEGLRGESRFEDVVLFGVSRSRSDQRTSASSSTMRILAEATSKYTDEFR